MARFKSGKFEVLTVEEIEAIHQTAVNVVREVGMMVQDEDVLRTMKEHGCTVYGNIVKFPQPIINSYLEEIREAKEKYKKTEVSRTQELYFNASSQALLACDVETNKVRPATTKDLADLGRVVDGIRSSGFPLGRSHPTFLPQDVPPLTRDVHVLATIAMSYSFEEGSIVSVYNYKSVPYMKEIGLIIRGSMEEFEKRPCFHFGTYIISPFKLGEDTFRVGKELRKHGLPFRLSLGNFIVAGATAPITLVGALVLQTAENIAAGIISKAIMRELGRYGGNPDVLDMWTGAPACGSSETLLLRLATAQIREHYMGFWAPPVGAHVSAHVPGLQAGIEKAIAMLFGFLCGARSFSALAALGNGDVGSIVQLMIDVEVGNYMRRLLRGINVTEDTLAKDVIIKAGIGASFLGNPHTVKHVRDEMWFPELMDRRNATEWMSNPKTMLANAREKAKRLIETAPNRSKLDKDQIREITKVVERADREIGGSP